MVATGAECAAAAAAAAANIPFHGVASTEWAPGCLFHGGNAYMYFSAHVDASAQDPTDAYICNP